MKKWSKEELKRMLFHNFIGTIADNVIEIGWVLCFSLIADKTFVERITTLFGLNDAFWVILGSSYYAVRTALTALLPKVLITQGEKAESKLIKNLLYLAYLILLPFAIISYWRMNELLQWLGVAVENLELYTAYFRLSIIAIVFSSPWAILLPAYYRSKGESRIAAKLDHAVAWTMIIGVFITTHLFNQGVFVALFIIILANSLSLFWFLYDRPIKDFFSKGVEFSKEELIEAWVIVKWELIRRLSPRITNFLGFSLIITINPLYLAIKYWLASIVTLIEGWVDASAGLLNSHVARNHALTIKGEDSGKPYSENNFVFLLSVLGVCITTFIAYLLVFFGLTFLPDGIREGVINKWVYLLTLIEVIAKLRYFSLLSISRSYKKELNPVAQLNYALPTIVVTPLLLWLFLHVFHWGLIGVFAVSTVVAIIQ